MTAERKAKVHDALLEIQDYLMKHVLPKMHNRATILVCKDFELDIIPDAVDGQVCLACLCVDINFVLVGESINSSTYQDAFTNLNICECLVGHWPQVKQRIWEVIREQEAYERSVEDFHI